MLLELARKPWCHTTANEGFVKSVLGSELMREYAD
jgi:cyanamide hydratase